MRAVEQGDIEIIDMWEEEDRPQDNTFRASSAATVTSQSHTASRTIGVLDSETPMQTRSGTGATAAGSTW